MNRGCLIGVLLFLVSFTVSAQTYPAKPIRLIVPFPPGSGTDAIARIIAPQLSDRLGKPVIIENRAGDSGNVGTALVATAAPDGYTLGMATPGPNAAGKALFPYLAFEPSKDFSPVILVNESPDVLLVHPSVAARSVSELVALAKANPGKLNAAIAAVGSMNHFVNELFKIGAGIDFINVPYKGGAPALADATGGQVDILFIGITAAIGLVQSGRLRALAVTSEKRVPLLPAIPTMREEGYPGVIGSQWNGIVAPAGTHRSIIERLNTELNAVLFSREIQEKFAQVGTTAVGGTPESFAGFLSAESERLARLIKNAGIKIE